MSWWEEDGKSSDWRTPAYVFTALGEIFDLDVAAPEGGCGSVVPARAFLSHGSLETPWHGFVWMNPPYGARNSVATCLAKFFGHGNGIALTPDRTSAPWFQSAWGAADAVLFTRKIRFLRPDGSEGVSPSNGTALWAASPRAVNALTRARDRGLGILALPVRMT